MQVAQTNSAINEAWGVIKVLSGDERARALAEAFSIQSCFPRRRESISPSLR